jgi:hypothetical protein
MHSLSVKCKAAGKCNHKQQQNRQHVVYYSNNSYYKTYFIKVIDILL